MAVNQPMHQRQVGHVEANQPLPVRHGPVVEQKDEKAHQSRVGLRRVVNKRVVLQSQFSC